MLINFLSFNSKRKTRGFLDSIFTRFCCVCRISNFSSTMANTLQRSLRATMVRRFSAEALVEIKPGEIGMVAGIPQEHLRRRVVIYSPARTASQQGSGKVGRWKINFLSTQKWENPLMGWTSTGDPYSHVGDSALTFDSEEAAKAFAEKHGWECLVKKRHTPLLKVKSYADNFKWKGMPKSDEE